MTRRASGDRGAVIVEAAVIFPILMLLTFGIVEYGLAFKNASTVTAASRDGARIGAAEPRTNGYDAAIVQAVQADLAAISSATPKFLWIYKADPATGNPIGASSGDPCPESTCAMWTWNSTSNSFVNPGDGWSYTAQSACLNYTAQPPQFPDALGVRVQVRHNFITKLFGSGIDLTEQTMMRLEPIPATHGCSSGGSGG